MTRRNVDYLIAASDVVEELRNNVSQVLPTSARVANKLANLPAKKQVEVWEEAVKTAPNGKPTAKQVKEVREKLSPRSEADSKMKAAGFKTLKGGYLLSPDVSELEHRERRAVEMSGSETPGHLHRYDLWQRYRKRKVRTKVLKVLGDVYKFPEEFSESIELLVTDLTRLVEVNKHTEKLG